jgi:hypothetical protein
MGPEGRCPCLPSLLREDNRNSSNNDNKKSKEKEREKEEEEEEEEEEEKNTSGCCATLGKMRPVIYSVYKMYKATAFAIHRGEYI